MVLGAFFYGFIITMLPGGYLAERYSSKIVILISAMGATFCSFLSPIIAKKGGYSGFMTLKVIQGLLQVMIFGLKVNMMIWFGPIDSLKNFVGSSKNW